MMIQLKELYRYAITTLGMEFATTTGIVEKLM
jgi:hypothetical protein